jgi:hypothetical protein
MAARVVPAARVSVPLLGRNLDAAAIAADPELALMVRGALAALASTAGSPRSVARIGAFGRV